MPMIRNWAFPIRMICSAGILFEMRSIFCSDQVLEKCDSFPLLTCGLILSSQQIVLLMATVRVGEFFEFCIK